MGDKLPNKLGGHQRMECCESLIRRLANDLTSGLARDSVGHNVTQMRTFYVAWPTAEICRHRLQNLPPSCTDPLRREGRASEAR